jgi:hypothetical protein
MQLVGGCFGLAPRYPVQKDTEKVEGDRMYISRLLFHTIPGKTGELENELNRLREMVASAGGRNSRILHTHFASLGAPDAVFEQEAADLNALETQISKLTGSSEFQNWSRRVSALLTQSPKREIYIVQP